MAEPLANEHELPLSTIAHEFLSPLAALRGYVELTIKEAPERLSPRQREHLQTALTAADRLQHFIEDVVLIARLESRAHALEPAELQPRALVAELQTRLRQLAPADLEVQARCAELAPLRLDAALMRRVLDRLSRHALYFVPKGGLLRIEAAEDAGAVSWTFLEAGVTLEPDELARFFERFLQPYFGEAGSRVRQNSLALAMAKLVVERHGGRMWVEQRTDGLAIRFTLPRQPPSAARYPEVSE